jgi:hypothetical protein
MDQLQIKPPVTEEEKKELFEQYKLVASSIDNSNQTRESLNTFWTSSHSIMLTILAFIMNNASLNDQEKNMVFWTLGVIGTLLCLFWMKAIGTIARTISIRNTILIKLEDYFPVNVFTVQIAKSKSMISSERLSVNEIVIPLFFFIGYGALAFYMSFLK